MTLNVLVRESQVAADKKELHDLNVQQKWVLVEHYLNECYQEHSVASESEHPPLVLFKVCLSA